MNKRIVVIAVFAGALIGCGDSKAPTAPTPAAGQRFVLRVEIEAPESMTPGSTAQFKVVVAYTDGSREDHTASATWSSSDAEVLSVTPGGIATALQDGEAEIVVQPPGTATARRLILVLGAGTWKLTGRVIEQDDTTAAVVNARVDVIEGHGAGKGATTDFSGNFRLYGVAGPITLRVSRDAFQTVTERVVVTSHSTIAPIRLPLVIPPVSLAGAWRLTLQASAACTTLPEAARHRTYQADVEQTGARLDIKLSGARFVHTYYTMNILQGRVQGTTLTLRADTWSYYGTPEYSLAEQLDDRTILTLAGAGTGTIQPSIISGAFSGVLAVSATLTAQPATVCQRDDHRFTLERTTGSIRQSARW